ncbi:MAG: biotin--[acetyl-CoA-carboxylase] ligase [candidate division Zixibacteria bacterium]|nr:biotin--[acetyl-CoA-carboxylase] ligase [candidate division Zixibacteria bacterium]
MEQDVYDINQIRRELNTMRFGHPMEFRERVTSTNDRVMDMALRGAPEGTIAFAEEQTSGRGRRGNVWYSPPRTGIWVSFLLRPRISGRHLPLLTLCAAHVAAQAIEETTGVSSCIKWPNDLLIEDRKVAGVLGEAKTMPREGPCVVVGMGINVNHEIEQFPPELQKTATSLRTVTGKIVVRQRLLCRLIERFEQVYQQYLHEGFAPFLPSLSKHLAWCGRTVEVTDITQTTTGVVVGLNDDGSLLLENDSARISVSSGTLRLRL